MSTKSTASTKTSTVAALAQSLLHAAPADAERRASSPWAYRPWAMFAVSVFLAYHVTVLVVWNLPREGLARDFHRILLRQVKGYEYFRATRNNQSWAMFAPDPVRINTFVHVVVEDHSGNRWDLQHDIWAKDRYPYLRYDRRAKVNRRLDGRRHYQHIYGAWVCRDWERRHGGEAAHSVTFTRRTTPVPRPEEVLARAGGWDPWQAPVELSEQETVVCESVAHGQLPNDLRERYGLEVIDDEQRFKTVRLPTWWERREQERREQEQGSRSARQQREPPNNE